MVYLVLLPSSPDTVHSITLHKTPISTFRERGPTYHTIRRGRLSASL